MVHYDSRRAQLPQLPFILERVKSTCKATTYLQTLLTAEINFDIVLSGIPYIKGLKHYRMVPPYQLFLLVRNVIKVYNKQSENYWLKIDSHSF